VGFAASGVAVKAAELAAMIVDYSVEDVQTDVPALKEKHEGTGSILGTAEAATVEASSQPFPNCILVSNLRS
jgi:hypothetical protein